MICKKNIAILAAVVIVLIAVTVFVFMWDGPTQQTDEASRTETIKIFECDAEEITRIYVTLPGEQIEFVRKDEENWQITGLEDAAIKNFSIGMLASDISSISAKSLVTEKADSLDNFGLANPSHSIVVTFKDGSTKTLYGGNKTAIGDAYYFKTADNDTVYTIYQSLFDSLFSPVDDYRDTANLFIDIQQVVGVNVKKQDYTLNLQLMDEPITMGGYNIATWEMTQPSYQTIDVSRLTTYVMDILPTVTVGSVVSDRKDYANYGLDNPYAVITVTNTDGSAHVIKLGNSNKDEYYILVNDDTTIYTANKSAFTYVDVDPFLLINKFVHIANIDDMSAVTVDAAGAQYKLAIEGDGDNKKYLFNGTEIEEEAFKTELYQQVIGLIVDEFCSDAVYGTPDVTIEFVTKDGGKTKIEFVDYDDRNYAVFKDGNCEFIILKKSVNSIVNALKDYK